MPETIREFLVGLGWTNDEASQRKFETAITTATLQAKLLGDAIEATARKVAASVTSVTANFENLFYQSSRMNMTARDITNLRYALEQTGVPLGEANAGLEAMGQQFRENPQAAMYWWGKFGLELDRVTGKFKYNAEEARRNAGSVTSPIFEMYRAHTGMSEQMAQALARHPEEIARFIAQSEGMLQGAGLDPEAAAKQGQALERVFRETFTRISVIANQFSTDLGADLQGPVTAFNKWLDDNSPTISTTLKDISKDLGEIASATTTAFKEFVISDEAKQGWGELRQDMQDIRSVMEWFIAHSKEAVDWLNYLSGVGRGPHAATDLNRAITGREHPLVDLYNWLQSFTPKTMSSAEELERMRTGRAISPGSVFLRQLNELFGIEEAHPAELPFIYPGRPHTPTPGTAYPFEQPEHPHTPTPQRSWWQRAGDLGSSIWNRLTGLLINGQPVSQSNPLPVTLSTQDMLALEGQQAFGGGAAIAGAGGVNAGVAGGVGSSGLGPGSGGRGGGAVSGSFMDALAQIESGNQNIPSGVDPDPPGYPGGRSQGYFQINTPTWRMFAVGTRGADYPNAMAAPRDVQAEVAARIPLARFGPRTQRMLIQEFGPLSLQETIGQLAHEHGTQPSAATDKVAIQASPTGTGMRARPPRTSPPPVPTGWRFVPQTGPRDAPDAAGLPTGAMRLVPEQHPAGWTAPVHTSMISDHLQRLAALGHQVTHNHQATTHQVAQDVSIKIEGANDPEMVARAVGTRLKRDAIAATTNLKGAFA